MKKRYLYLIECMRDGTNWRKGDTIWAHAPCKGWRIVGKQEIKL